MRGQLGRLDRHLEAGRDAVSSVPRLTEAAATRMGRLRYCRAGLQPRVLHIGPGAFFRAHQADYFDRLNAVEPRWGIRAVSMRSQTVAHSLGPQDWLYTLELRGETIEHRVIGALSDVRPLSDYSPDLFMSPALSIVTLTVTEKGYCLNAASTLDFHNSDVTHDMAHPEAPRSALGLLVQGLALRYRHALAPPVILSCDNLSDNGRLLRDAVVELAHAHNRGLAHWIEDQVPFPSSMVDAITPATDPPLIDRVAKSCGLLDALPVQRESFTSWVIEVTDGVRLPQLDEVGVILTRDARPHAQAKLRLLNGAHSTLAYLGLARGLETVSESMADEPLRAIVEQMMRSEVVPSIGTITELNLNEYQQALLRRFANRSLEHRLSQIAWDGSKKLPIRLLGTIADNLDAGAPVHNACLGVAAWCRFVVGQSRAGLKIVDPIAPRLAHIGRQCSDDAAEDVARFLALREVFGPHLSTRSTFIDAVRKAYDQVVAMEEQARHSP